MPRRPSPDPFVLDTLGKLYAHGHELGGYCLDCRRLFDVEVMDLIDERGIDTQVVGMEPLICPGCGSDHTAMKITAPSKGG